MSDLILINFLWIFLVISTSPLKVWPRFVGTSSSICADLTSGHHPEAHIEKKPSSEDPPAPSSSSTPDKLPHTDDDTPSKDQTSQACHGHIDGPPGWSWWWRVKNWLSSSPKISNGSVTCLNGSQVKGARVVCCCVLPSPHNRGTIRQSPGLSTVPCHFLTTFSISYCCGPLGGYGSIHSHVNRRAALIKVRNWKASTALWERYLTSIVFTMLKSSTLRARVEPSAQPLSIALGIKRS